MVRFAPRGGLSGQPYGYRAGPGGTAQQEDTMQIPYETPTITDLGSITEHTFQTPGQGTKSDDTTFELDKFLEHSHPAGS